MNTATHYRSVSVPDSGKHSKILYRKGANGYAEYYSKPLNRWGLSATIQNNKMDELLCRIAML